MKLVAILASVMMAVPAAFAQEQVFEVEDGAMSQEAAQVLTPMMEPQQMGPDSDRGGAIIGGIIGGIIGAIGSDIIDRDDRYNRRNVTCYARDRRGNVYRAVGRRARNVQNQALNKCERNARFCRPAGCHVH